MREMLESMSRGLLQSMARPTPRCRDSQRERASHGRGSGRPLEPGALCSRNRKKTMRTPRNAFKHVVPRVERIHSVDLLARDRPCNENYSRLILRGFLSVDGGGA